MTELPVTHKRLVLLASILGSGAVFLESTVVTVALPAIGRDFGLGLDGLQWVVNAYLLTLGSLILLGGALGDRYQRELVFRIGAAGFAVTSALCAVAPTPGVLALLRFVQGVAGALLVPNSLALLEQTFSGEERGSAIGAWAAGSAASTAVGPLLGGAIVSAISWRWVFALVVPFGLLAALLLPRARSVAGSELPHTRIDYVGALLITAGLGALVAALISGPTLGFTSVPVLAGLLAGGILLVAFVAVEARTRDPLVPLGVFRSRQFSGVNVATFLIYGALGALLFLLILVLQNVVGYSALAAGSALLPINALLVLGSGTAGRTAQRIGPRVPIALGALTAGAGLLLLTRAASATSYVRDVLPGIVVFGVGLTALVAPLTSAVLESLGRGRAGLASGVNNAVARLAGLIATAAVPLAAGLGGLQELGGAPLAQGFVRAMWICAALCAAGGVAAWLTVGGSGDVSAIPRSR